MSDDDTIVYHLYSCESVESSTQVTKKDGEACREMFRGSNVTRMQSCHQVCWRTVHWTEGEHQHNQPSPYHLRRCRTFLLAFTLLPARSVPSSVVLYRRSIHPILCRVNASSLLDGRLTRGYCFANLAILSNAYPPPKSSPRLLYFTSTEHQARLVHTRAYTFFLSVAAVAAARPVEIPRRVLIAIINSFFFISFSHIFLFLSYTIITTTRKRTCARDMGHKFLEIENQSLSII